MHHPKACGLSPYSSNSSYARRIEESNRRYKVIVAIVWRVTVTISALNCIYMHAVVQVTQAVARTAPLQQQWIAMLLLGGMHLLK